MEILIVLIMRANVIIHLNNSQLIIRCIIGRFWVEVGKFLGDLMGMVADSQTELLWV